MSGLERSRRERGQYWKKDKRKWDGIGIRAEHKSRTFGEEEWRRWQRTEVSASVKMCCDLSFSCFSVTRGA